MKAALAYIAGAIILAIIGFVFLVKAVLALWAHDIWFIGFGFGAVFFFKWACGVFDLATATTADLITKRMDAQRKARLSETGFLKEEPSTRLSDQFGSFRDLGRR